MLSNGKKKSMRQSGMSLVEILVGLVIGMLATLVIMQTFAAFEGQKRSTTGNADAQTNGSIALFTMQRDLQMAGFGLSVFDTINSPLKCDPLPTVDHDANVATPVIGISPVTITDGGAVAGASDMIAVRYSTDGASAKNGISVKINDASNATTSGVGVDNNLGCNNGDVVMVSLGTACTMTTVNDADLAADTTHITLKSSTGVLSGASLACMGRWNQFDYSVAGSQLLRRDATQAVASPVVAEIVNVQAQYGVSAAGLSNDNPNFNQVASWEDASGDWAPAVITVANRNRIKAVRIAVIARNGLLEKDNVTSTCTTNKGTVNKGPCAWDDTDVDAAPKVDLSNNADWQRYRYRVYETIIPLRNMIWSKNTL